MANNPPADSFFITEGGQQVGVSRQERTMLLVAVLIISICALTYELIVGTLSSYLLGNSVAQFSFTIGFFLFAMGLGSLLSRRIQDNELRWFIVVELLIALFGGTSAIILYAVFATEDVYYYTVMLAISTAIGICVGLEIPLLTRIVAHDGSLGNALADVLSVDYIGALVASLMFPIVLLPLLGVTLTAFLMGLFNIFVASLLLWAFRRRLPRRWRRGLWAACGAVMALMLTGTVFSANVVNFFEQRLYTDRVIFREQTPYQRLIITRDGRDVRLFIDGNLQFSSRDEYRYHEMLVHPAMSAARAHEQVLVLGGGDGLVARELLKYDGIETITVVDLDPRMTELARSHPLLSDFNEGALDDPRVDIINADAFNFVQNDDSLYNVIILDLPDPNNEGLSKLYSEEFYRMLHERITPDGVLVTQAASPYFVREAFWMIANTLNTAGFDVQPLRAYVPSFGEWGFVVAAPRHLPEMTVNEDLSLRYLTPDVLQAAMIFDPDTDRIETDINTLDHPILPAAYERGWRQWNN